VAVQIEGSTLLETTWTIIPLGPFIGDVRMGRAGLFPRLTAAGQRHEHLRGGQQWSVEGRASGRQHEINSLHVPVGHAVQLTLFQRTCFTAFYSGFSREARGDSRPANDGLV